MHTEADERFIRAVVELAREHGMNHLTITYDNNSLKNYLVKVPRSDRVQATWAEGRKGEEQNITIETRNSVNVAEKANGENA